MIADFTIKCHKCENSDPWIYKGHELNSIVIVCDKCNVKRYITQLDKYVP